MCVYVYIYMYACLIQVYSMDSVPLKMPQGAPQKVNEDIQVIVPDYLSILQETEVSVYVNMLRWATQSLCLCFSRSFLQKHRKFLFDHSFPVLEVAQTKSFTFFTKRGKLHPYRDLLPSWI